ncbi:MAG: alpha/beta fold hydrolase [Beijerinckiaceae bacterium]
MTEILTPAPYILEEAAIRHETPCGDGVMVWREWGAGEPLVLLHGGSGSWRHWIRNIEFLAQRFRVIAADTPGYGSSALPPEPYDFTSIGKIMGAGLDAILQPGQACHVAGFSLGSFMAPHMIVNSERTAKSLCLVHGHLVGHMEYSPQATLKRWRNVEDQDERREILRHNLGSLMLAHPESADDATIDLYGQDLEASRLRVTNFIAGLDTDILTRIDARLCSISGELDPTASPDVATQAAKLKALRPDVSTHIVENAGHWVMYEAADTFHELVLDFLVNNS